jgi:hypothetical protein
MLTGSLVALFFAVLALIGAMSALVFIFAVGRAMT